MTVQMQTPKDDSVDFVGLQRIKNLSKVKLVDAGFIWTEPHSKRLKLKVRICTCFFARLDVLRQLLL